MFYRRCVRRPESSVGKRTERLVEVVAVVDRIVDNPMPVDFRPASRLAAGGGRRRFRSRGVRQFAL